MLEKILTTFCNNLARNIFTIVRNMFNHMDATVNNGLTGITFSIPFYLGIVSIIIMFAWYQLRYRLQDESTIQGSLNKAHIHKKYIKDGMKKLAAPLGVVMFMYLFHNQIIQFSFNFWKEIFNDEMLINLLEKTSKGSIINALIAAGGSLYIGITQMIEYFILTITIVLFPITLPLVFLGHTRMVSSLFKEILTLIMGPIIQSVVMYALIYPQIYFSEKPSFNEIFLLISIFSGLRISSIVTEVILKSTEDTLDNTDTIEMIGVLNEVKKQNSIL